MFENSHFTTHCPWIHHLEADVTFYPQLLGLNFSKQELDTKYVVSNAGFAHSRYTRKLTPFF